MPDNDLERKVSMKNDDQESVELLVDDFGGAMRVCLTIPAYREEGVKKYDQQSFQFTSSEWDLLVAEVERARAARKLFNLPT